MRVAHRLVTTVVAVMCAATAFAQSPPPDQQWEIEVHAGVAAAFDGTKGKGQLPSAGPVSTDPVFRINGQPVSTRLVPSWYFGDGAAELNQVVGSIRGPGVTPLDSILGGLLVRQNGGGSFGLRVAKTLTRRLSAELSFDRNIAPLTLTNHAKEGIEASRASFVTTWNAVLVGSVSANRSVSSIAALTDRRGHQSLTMGMLLVNIGRWRTLSPYLAAGGGVISSERAAPKAQLVGQYRFQLANVVPPFPASPEFHETDAVTITSSAVAAPAAAFGGGVKLALSDRWGLRIDLRDYISRNTSATLVSANPASAPAPAGTPPGIFGLGTFGTPFELRFSTTSSAPSSLSVTSVSGFKTFEAAGISNRASLSAGLYWRF